MIAGAEAWVRGARQISAERPEGPLGRRVAEAAGTVGSADIFYAAEEGETAAEALIRDSGFCIGQALASLVSFFNPAEIVLGGRLGVGSNLLIASIRQAVYAYALPLATRNLVLSRSIAGDEAGVAGAAFTALTGLYEASRIATWE